MRCAANQRVYEDTLTGQRLMSLAQWTMQTLLEHLRKCGCLELQDCMRDARTVVAHKVICQL